jgi:hypothetical protein
MTAPIEILENELRLKVNNDKSHITSITEGVALLGFIIRRKYISINPSRKQLLYVTIVIIFSAGIFNFRTLV